MQLTFRPKPYRRRKPYIWRFLADWERDGWNGVSYDGVVRHSEAIPLQRLAFTARKVKPGRRLRAWAYLAMRRAFNRYKPPMRRRYLAMMAKCR